MFETRQRLVRTNRHLKKQCSYLEESNEDLKITVKRLRRKIIKDAIGMEAYDELLELRGKVKGLSSILGKPAWQIR